MTDVYALNQVPPGGETTRDLYMAWDLGRKMIDAGWTVWGSSNGTSFSTSGTDHWTTYANSNNAGAWLALINPDGLRGYCFQCDTVGAYGITYGRVFSYTQTGWSSSGASATVAPLAAGNTAYMSSGTPGSPFYNYFSAGAGDPPNRECHVYHLIVKDAATDGSIFALGFKNGGGSPGANLVHFFVASAVYSPWELPVSDNYVFWTGTAVGGPGSGWLPGSYPGPSLTPPSSSQFRAKPPQDAALRNAKTAPTAFYPGGALTINLANVHDGFGDASATYSGSSTMMIESMAFYTDAGVGPIYKGVAKWIVGRNATVSAGFQGNYDWYAFDSDGAGNLLWVPWDGATATFNSGT